MSVAEEIAQPFLRRLWIYQSERFPIFLHGVVIAALAAGAVGVSALQRGAAFEGAAFAAAFVALFGFFLQLRVADEHKDAEDDARYRPERPVARGLISLKELRAVAILAAIAQVAAVAVIDARALAFVVLAWAWMGLMTVEFFAPAWLKARPVLYMLSHMAVMPLLVLAAAASDFAPSLGLDPRPLGPAFAAFLGLCFANGAALEIARKTWAPEQERAGVETYSKLWGVRGAAVAVAVVSLAAAGLGALAAPALWAPLGALVGLTLACAYRYAQAAAPARAKALEAAAGLWALGSPLIVGVAPHLWSIA